MGFLSTLGTIAGTALGGPVGAAAGGALGGLGDSFLGGGSKSSGGGGGGGGGYTQAMSNPYAQSAAQLAAQNNPLTAAYQGLSLMQGALAGQMSTKATTEACNLVSA